MFHEGAAYSKGVYIYVMEMRTESLNYFNKKA